jgi:hypothetical protein
VRINEEGAAKKYFNVLKQIAPDAPATQSARKVLEHRSLLRTLEEAIRRLAERPPKRRLRRLT